MTSRRGLRGLAGLAALTISELATRALVYALAPPAARLAQLRGALGGPRLLIVSVIGPGLALGLSAGVLALAALGARERWALSDTRIRGAPPRLPWGALSRRWAVLWIASMAAFVAIENYVHVRAGLGFHGPGCLVGHAHVNAIPVSAAISLVVAAAATAAEHLLLWMGRVVRRLLGSRARSRRPSRSLPKPHSATLRARVETLTVLRPRPPPVALRT